MTSALFFLACIFLLAIFWPKKKKPANWYLPTAVYRLYGRPKRRRWLEKEHPLYIGVSNAPLIRFGQHAADKWWWFQVDPSRTTITWYPNREKALKAELKAIRSENPRYNILGKPGYRGKYKNEQEMV